MTENEMLRRCAGCMRLLDGTQVCSVCGTPLVYTQPAPFLPVRTVLAQGRYGVGRIVSHNGDGATYLGFDIAAQRPVYLREFLPEAIAQREPGECVLRVMPGCEPVWQDCAQNFLELWRKLQRLRGLFSLIAVTDVFEENSTIYAVQEYAEAMTLRDFLLRGKQGCISWERARGLLMPVLSTLGSLHTQGILHRGISPNTLFFGSDGKVRIGGFSIWQARAAHGSLTAELSEGYAALEQYGLDGKQGAWTDIYAFAAVLYRTLVGSDPEDAVSRQHNDRVMVPAQVAERIPAYVINAMINAMQIFPEDRTATVEQLRAELSASPAAAHAAQPLPTRVQTVLPPSGAVAPEGAGKKKKNASGGSVALKTAAAVIGAGLVVTAAVLLMFFREDLTAALERLRPPTTVAQTSTADIGLAPEKRKLENFVGKLYTEQFSTEYLKGEFVLTVEWRADPAKPENTILEQKPAAGTLLETGSTVTLVVCSAPTVRLPAVLGKNIREMRDKLEALGFVVFLNETRNDGSETAGVIYAVVPQENEDYKKGREVYISYWGGTDGKPVLPGAQAEETTSAATEG
ncbi:MAG: protein kinase [Oscillospiraceae bacterium]|jgi:serine/threonine-protein kinase|nr:protein kinase [Oscillospiraceae bacterium]